MPAYEHVNLPPALLRVLDALILDAEDQLEHPSIIPPLRDPINRAICLDCRGNPAPLWKCRMCESTGNVCPLCRGMRFVRQPLGDGSYGDTAIRCVGCCEGNQVNPIKEQAIIAAYMARFRHSRLNHATEAKGALAMA